MSRARLSSYIDKRYNGVCVLIEEFDAQTLKVLRYISVVYTPDIARRLAHEIVVQADTLDALGGPTKELLSLCTDRGEAKPGSAS